MSLSVISLGVNIFHNKKNTKEIRMSMRKLYTPIFSWDFLHFNIFFLPVRECELTLFPEKVSQTSSLPSCDALTICLWRK